MIYHTPPDYFTVRSLVFYIELWLPWFDVHVTYTLILDVLVEKSLKLMSPIGSDSTDAKGKFLNHIVYEIYSIFPVVS